MIKLTVNTVLHDTIQVSNYIKTLFGLTPDTRIKTAIDKKTGEHIADVDSGADITAYSEFLNLDENARYIFNGEEGSLEVSVESGKVYFLLTVYNQNKINEEALLDLVSSTGFRKIRGNIVLDGELPTETGERLLKDFGITSKEYGVALSWIFTIEFGEAQRHNFDYDYTVSAPVYRVYKSDDKSRIVLQLTKEVVSGFDNRYYDAYSELHNYFTEFKRN